MRHVFPLAAAFLLASAAAAQAPGTGGVRVVLLTQKTGGPVAIALYAGPESFPKTNGAFRQAKAPVRNGRAEATFDGLPPGVYAVGAFHDVDADGRLDTLPVGLPTEPYGFSRDARGAFGPPKWSQAAFKVEADATVTQTVRLK